jgi:hypothetical protein
MTRVGYVSLQGERENYERSLKRPKHMLTATKHGSVRAAMPMMQVQG